MIWRSIQAFFSSDPEPEEPGDKECCITTPGGVCPNPPEEEDGYDPFSESRHGNDDDMLTEFYRGTTCEIPYQEVKQARKKMLDEAARLAKIANDSRVYKVKSPEQLESDDRRRIKRRRDSKKRMPA